MQLPWSLHLAAIFFWSAASCQSSSSQPALAIVRSQAEVAALVEAPGSTIINGVLEKRDERWGWAFQAISPGVSSPREVLVNARTGAAITEKSLAYAGREAT